MKATLATLPFLLHVWWISDWRQWVLLLLGQALFRHMPRVDSYQYVRSWTRISENGQFIPSISPLFAAVCHIHSE